MERKRTSQQRPPTGPVRTKNYLLIGEYVFCYSSETEKCGLANFVAPKRATPVHDEDLMQCTKDINAILSKVRKSNRGKDVELHLLDTPRGFLLAWANCDGITGDDDTTAINQAFGI